MRSNPSVISIWVEDITGIIVQETAQYEQLISPQAG